MSKIQRPIQLIPAAFVLILQFFTFSAGQAVDVTITVGGKSPTIIHVQGRRNRDHQARLPKFLDFMSAYAGVTGLEKRISGMRLFDDQGLEMLSTKTDSSFAAERGILSWSCNVDLVPILRTAAASHTSWLGPDGGVIVLDDFMPQRWGRSAKVKLELPADWSVFTTERSVRPNEFQVPNIERTAFVIGRNWSEREIKVVEASIRLLSKGDWTFSQTEASAMISEVFEHYSGLIGNPRSIRNHIVLYRFPSGVPPGEWEADTRGSTVTIASSDMPFKTQSLQRLHEQLRHEIFHLWIPNGVNLTGSYDWFYEGFALYQSLKMGVAVNRIRFDDYLDTLSRAYAIDARQPGKGSMIESSQNRWSGSNTYVYARGMLVAFLCDLAMLDASKGKRSTTDLLREIYAKHSGDTRPEDGNTAVLAVMKRYPELAAVAERYVTGAEKLDWSTMIRAAGIEADPKGGRLSVAAKLSGRQKDLLDKLGYNSWRKLANGK